MRPKDRAPNAITLALIVLLALALGPGVAVPQKRARTGHRPGLRLDEAASARPLPAPVRTLDR